MARSCWDEEACAHVKADRAPKGQDLNSPLLYENAKAECEQNGHQFKRWQLPSGPLKALCCICGRTFPLELVA